MDYITKYDSPNYTRKQVLLAQYGIKRVVNSIVIHHWDDPAKLPSFNGVINHLCRPNGNSSAHLVVEAGRAAWLVDAEHMAWHAGPYGNPHSIGIECNPRASEADYLAVAEVVADLRNVYGDITIFSHDYWMNTECPGRWDVFKVDRMSYTILKRKYGKVF